MCIDKTIYLIFSFLKLDTLTEYEKISDQFCGKGNSCNTDSNPRYGNFTSFDVAISTCNSDESCKMVMDEHCNGQGPYELCSSSQLCKSGRQTCSYEKTISNQLHLIVSGNEIP